LSTPASNQNHPLASLGERELVARIRQRFPAPPALLPVGIGDDAAVAVPERGALEILTTDALVEGVHFDRSFCPLGDVGYKALAVNVSDVASMGGMPRLALLSLMLPAAFAAADVDALLDGFAEMAAAARVTLAGGNITRSPGPLVIDVSLVGSVRPRKVLTRAGGRPGDAIYVTGAVGAAAAGLGWLRASPTLERPVEPEIEFCVQRYRRPEPRTRFGASLGQSRAATACMDLSDGLADAVRQIAEASGTGASLDGAALPIPDAAARWFSAQGTDPVQAALRGGDDYELLFTVPARRRGRLAHALRQARGLAVTRIGELTPGSTIAVVRDGRAEALPDGFVHF
jgi:thiamine-monophosphate kinase